MTLLPSSGSNPDMLNPDRTTAERDTASAASTGVVDNLEEEPSGISSNDPGVLVGAPLADDHDLAADLPTPGSPTPEQTTTRQSSSASSVGPLPVVPGTISSGNTSASGSSNSSVTAGKGGGNPGGIAAHLRGIDRQLIKNVAEGTAVKILTQEEEDFPVRVARCELNTMQIRPVVNSGRISRKNCLSKTYRKRVEQRQLGRGVW